MSDWYAMATEDDVADAVRKLEGDRQLRAATVSDFETDSYESLADVTPTNAKVANSNRLN